jgi:hypothetical protein
MGRTESHEIGVEDANRWEVAMGSTQDYRMRDQKLQMALLRAVGTRRTDSPMELEWSGPRTPRHTMRQNATLSQVD